MVYGQITSHKDYNYCFPIKSETMNEGDTWEKGGDFKNSYCIILVFNILYNFLIYTLAFCESSNTKQNRNMAFIRRTQLTANLGGRCWTVFLTEVNTECTLIEC